MITTLSIIGIIVLSIFAFLQHPKFGRTPRKERLEKIKNSPNYKNGAFQNITPTPVMAEDVKFSQIMRDFIKSRKNRLKPESSIPTIKTDLLNLDISKDILVWFGHSSYFIQIDGKRILVDPVFSKSASPVPVIIKAFKGTNLYSADDIPEIDYLFITHDHWDHLDFKTIVKLKPKIKKIICGLGTGEHLERWGYDKNKITELDWNEETIPDDGFRAYTVPARHFSGRRFKRNQTLWTAFVLTTPTMKIFMSGDGGYDKHFAEAQKKFGDIDLAILENGQNNKNWKYIHTSPEQVLQAAKDLHAKRILPVHSSKFSLAMHNWDEPLKRITELNKEFNLNVITPMIGEKVNLKDSEQKFSRWWEEVK